MYYLSTSNLAKTKQPETMNLSPSEHFVAEMMANYLGRGSSKTGLAPRTCDLWLRGEELKFWECSSI